MINRVRNCRNFAEAGKLPILARGRSIKNSVSAVHITDYFQFIFNMLPPDFSNQATNLSLSIFKKDSLTGLQ
jgi:hypothetical protein